MNTPLNIVVIPVPVAGQTYNKRAGKPVYPPRQSQERWPLSSPIPTEETRRMLDDARRRMTIERDQIARLARQGV
jgi:hypothetical protein